MTTTTITKDATELRLEREFERAKANLARCTPGTSRYFFAGGEMAFAGTRLAEYRRHGDESQLMRRLPGGALEDRPDLDGQEIS